jgi:phosphatidylserine/phosphatidylglycerophosphate/cardiolipin synthase-like enzyme
MQPLLDAIVDLVTLISPGKVRTIASALRGLSAPSASVNANTLVDTPAARAAVVRVIEAWSQEPMSGAEVAGMLVGAAEARHHGERDLSIELVWTGPTTRFVPTRRTEQVLLDLVAMATLELFLVSFVAYDVPNVVSALNKAVARGVRVRILVEASSSHGGSLNVDPAAMMRASVPAAEVFSWKDKIEPFAGGKVHAKVAVIDASRAFITSANLTGHALEKNMEAGVLVTGGMVPKSLAEHLNALVDVGVVHRV